MNKYCPECHKEYENGKFCPECGAKLIEMQIVMYCPTCDRVVDGGKFCPECGSKLVEKAVLPESSLSEVSSEANVICPACGFPNDSGAQNCFACGYPLVGDTPPPCKNNITDNETESILSKYRTEYGDMREPAEEEKENALSEISQLADRGIPEAQYFLACIYMGIDNDKSYQLLCNAERNGFKMAGAALGMFYAHGIIVNKDPNEAVRRLSSAKESPAISSALGDVYFDIIRDFNKALQCYSYAASKNEKEGYCGLANMYRDGVGVPQDYAKAFENYNLAVALGSSEAEYELGNLYFNGHGTPVDYDEALRWYTEAANHNHCVAINALAFMHMNGCGVEKDEEKAGDYFKRSAELGSLEAMTQLGYYYISVIEDPQKAYKWTKKAADCGYPEALWNLGDCYESGIGVKEDSAKAEKYHEMARAAGYEKSETSETSGNANTDLVTDDNGIDAAIQAIEDGDFDMALSILKPLANIGDAEAQYEYAKCYQNGNGVKKNTSVAASWLKKSAEAGYSPACYAMGQRNEMGIDITPNQEQAAKWYRKAADYGHPDAQFRLGLMYDEGRGVTQNGKKAADLIKKAAESGSTEAQAYIKSAIDGASAVIRKIQIEKNIPYTITGRPGLRFWVEFDAHNMIGKKVNCTIDFLWPRGPVTANSDDPKSLNVNGKVIAGRSEVVKDQDCSFKFHFEVPYDILCNHNSKGRWNITAKVRIRDLSTKEAKVLKSAEKHIEIVCTKKFLSGYEYIVNIKK